MNISLDKSGRLKKLVTLAKPLKSKDIEFAIKLYERVNGNIDSYSNSTDYDLLFKRKTYPPKAIFGIALSQLLGFDVLSRHFSGGIDSPCFRTLERLGFDIIEKPKPGINEGLIAYNKYNRENVCKIFDPECIFKAGSGRWGLSGIVSHTPCKNDFVLFVTLDNQDDNDYEDYLTEDGVLVWMSQNQHTPNCNIIRILSSHNEDLNNINLFIRTSKGKQYTFLGPLALRDWNPNSTNPVHFMWNIINWPLSEETHNEFKNYIKPAVTPGYKPLTFNVQKLIEVEKPIPANKHGTKRSRKINRNIDWATKEKRNRELGLAGEKLVIEYERNILMELNRHDLAEKVKHIALQDSSAGYDVLSYDKDGNQKYIEVKTTSYTKNTPFYISRNEVMKSKILADGFWVYRLFNFDSKGTQTEFFCVNGPVDDEFVLIPENYKATVK